MWVQRDLFYCVEVQGTSAHRCIGFRDRRDMFRPDARVVFIDALGLPICCRIVPRSRLCVQDFLILLNFDVPQGYYAEFTGEEVDQLNPNFRHFRHCSSVVIWLEPLQPESVPENSSCDDEGGGSDDPDPSDGDDHDTDGTSREEGRRSRSPRRQTSPPAGNFTREDEHPAEAGRRTPADEIQCNQYTCCETAARPLPTPCQAPCRPPTCTASLFEEGSVCLDVHELRTLLDEGSRPRYDDVVCQATKQWVYFPREDSQSVQLSNQHVAGEACRILRISDHIEPRTFDLTCQQAPVERNLDEVCHLQPSQGHEIPSSEYPSLCFFQGRYPPGHTGRQASCLQHGPFCSDFF